MTQNTKVSVSFSNTVSLDTVVFHLVQWITKMTLIGCWVWKEALGYGCGPNGASLFSGAFQVYTPLISFILDCPWHKVWTLCWVYCLELWHMSVLWLTPPLSLCVNKASLWRLLTTSVCFRLPSAPAVAPLKAMAFSLFTLPLSFLQIGLSHLYCGLEPMAKKRDDLSPLLPVFEGPGEMITHFLIQSLF